MVKHILHCNLKMKQKMRTEQRHLSLSKNAGLVSKWVYKIINWVRKSSVNFIFDFNGLHIWNRSVTHLKVIMREMCLVFGDHTEAKQTRRKNQTVITGNA